MPCRSEPFDEVPVRSSVSEKQLDTMKREVETLESLLCSTCRVLERFGFEFDENPRLSEWWDKHKKADAAREKQELKKRLRQEQIAELVKKPFKELTKEDKKLLKEEGYL